MSSSEGLIEANAQEIAEKIGLAAHEANSEAALRIMVEHALRDVLDRLGIAWGSYEYTLVEGRPDALYGRVVIEYEKPGVLSIAAGFKHAIEQAVGYIKELTPSVELYPKYFGIVLDGYQIGFVRFRRTWDIQGPFAVNKQTVLKLLEAIRGLRRKPLKADLLNKDLGPESIVAKVVVGAFYRKLKAATTPRVEMLFEDWKRVFGQVCGYSPEKIKGLEEVYGLKKDQIDYEALLFSVHTYFGLVMKLLAAEVAVSLGGSYLQSYIKKLENAYLKGSEKLKETLKDLEEGEIFSRIGIKNFLEGDYFAWYLDLWDEVLAEAVNKVAKALSDYEPATVELEPDKVKDMLKRLYQYLVPKKIRHDLGEYYTPDWLAELVLNEVGYDGNVEKRLLDPACGSGTFLLLAIKRAKQNALDGFINESDTLEKILKNIVGFDLNPLAVIAARTNYLIVLGELIRYRKRDIELPIYLADSILVERKTTLTGPTYVSRTVAGLFEIPVGIVERGLLASVLAIIEECVKARYAKDEFKGRLLREVNMEQNEAQILIELFDTLSKLEKKGKNRIWVRVLKNSLAPLFARRFDYVVGNPPWVNWENLPESYRNITTDLWSIYGLLEGGKIQGLGKIRRDLATLFITRCFDRYVNENGVLSFLLPFNVLKTQGGLGFRGFLASKVKVLKVHDLSELYPFEGATNRTGLMAIGHGKTIFPIECTIWSAPKAVPPETEIIEIPKTTTRTDMIIGPIETEKSQSPWAIMTSKAYDAIKKVVHPSTYKGKEGTNPALIGVYWVNVIAKQPTGLLVRNMGGVKKKVEQVEDVVEGSLVYPLIRGRDVKKWLAKPSGYYIIVPHDLTGKPINDSRMKVNFPKSYRFFLNFQDALEKRSIHKLWGKGKPFYSIYDIGGYTFKPYKVLWKDISGKISARGEFGGAAVIDPVSDAYCGKKLAIPDGTLMFITCRNSEEAHYLAAILNSTIVRFIAKAYTVVHVRGHIIKYTGLPEFDSVNCLHKDLATLSKKAHELAALRVEEELAKVEGEIDNLVRQLYGLTNEELQDIKESLKTLESGAERPEAEEEAAEESKPETIPKRALERLVENFKEEQP